MDYTSLCDEADKLWDVIIQQNYKNLADIWLEVKMTKLFSSVFWQATLQAISLNCMIKFEVQLIKMSIVSLYFFATNTSGQLKISITIGVLTDWFAHLRRSMAFSTRSFLCVFQWSSYLMGGVITHYTLLEVKCKFAASFICILWVAL